MNSAVSQILATPDCSQDNMPFQKISMLENKHVVTLILDISMIFLQGTYNLWEHTRN